MGGIYIALVHLRNGFCIHMQLNIILICVVQMVESMWNGLQNLDETVNKMMVALLVIRKILMIFLS